MRVQEVQVHQRLDPEQFERQPSRRTEAGQQTSGARRTRMKFLIATDRRTDLVTLTGYVFLEDLRREIACALGDDTADGYVPPRQPSYASEPLKAPKETMSSSDSPPAPR